MNVLPTTPLPPAPRPRVAGQQLPRWADLKKIGDAQRLVLLTFLVGLLAIPASAAIGAAFGAYRPDHGDIAIGVIPVLALVLGVRAWMAVGVYRLARALGSRLAVLWAIGAFIPNFIGLIVLVAISLRATSRLKKAGVKVGLLGAKLPESPPPGFLCEEVAGAFS